MTLYSLIWDNEPHKHAAKMKIPQISLCPITIQMNPQFIRKQWYRSTGAEKKNCRQSVKLCEPLSRNRHPNMTQNEDVYAICCRPEVAGDVIFGGNVKALDGYAVLNF